MVGNPQIVAVIPARGGSKSIPRKNIKHLGGIPLIAYSIAAAKEAQLVDRIIVSTDDEEIAAIARDWGADVPFLRPKNLADDNTTDLPVFQHVVEWLRQSGEEPELIIQLRPTSPFRPQNCVDEAIKLLLNNKSADSVRGVTASGQNPYKMWRIKNGILNPLLKSEFKEAYNMPRQELPETFWQTGHIEAIRVNTLLGKQSMTGEQILPFVIEPVFAIDLDTLTQWQFAEFMVYDEELKKDRIDPVRILRPGTINVHDVAPGPEVSYSQTENQRKDTTVKEQLSKLKLVVFDFDGVFTDDRVWINQEGVESVACSREDGMGLALLCKHQLPVVVVSTEENPVVAARCRKLKIPCMQGVWKKEEAVKQLAQEYRVTLKQMAFVGNDVNDIPVMKAVGLPVAVANAHQQVKDIAALVLSKEGGRGAVREFCELLIQTFLGE